MTDRDKLASFAEQLIKQKRLIRAIKNILSLSFIALIAGSLAALPLRYFFGLDSPAPLGLLAGACLLSFIYGFLGVETHLSILRESDEKMGLKEKLSAAYQFGQSDNPYSTLIMGEALRLIETIKPGNVFPVIFSKRDPFIPLLTGLCLFLWMSSFSFLQISDRQMAIGDILLDSSERIDAVNSGEKDKDLEELAEEYRKLGQKIQDRFMNDKSIDREVEELSLRLEKKIEELSREGVQKESRTLSDEEADSEIYQLERKREMGDELGDILESLMKTFSLTPDMRLGSSVERRDGMSGEGGLSEERNSESPPGSAEEGTPAEDSESSDSARTGAPDKGETGEQGEDLQDSDSSQGKPGKSDGLEKDNSKSGNTDPLSPFFDKEEKISDFDPASPPGEEMTEDMGDFQPFREKKESGEFGEEDNIRGDLREGEQIKSFIRALPHIVEPTKEEMDIIHFYRNQLESAIDREILPPGYESVIRDYFLAIGVLNDE
ncbi:MAG: hypothetical protein JXR86_16950 [Spirochaetales bacterium]|nr:hypothetical protein [Spirochaetales bacterium]